MNRNSMKINDPDLRTLSILKGILILVFTIPLSFFSFSFVSHTHWILTIPLLLVLFELFLLAVGKLVQKEGIEINFKTLEYKNFKKTLFYETGVWKNLEHFQSLVILSKRGKKTIGDKDLQAFDLARAEFHVQINELYFMTKNHVQRVFVVSYRTRERLLELAKKIESLTHLKIETYSPTTSRNRRR